MLDKTRALVSILAVKMTIKPHPWYESPFWGPLTIAIIGSLIVLVGQLSSVVIPVLIGPDLSDYSLVCTPSYHEISLNQTNAVDVWDDGTRRSLNRTKIIDMLVNGKIVEFAPFDLYITIKSLHPLQRYSRQVFLTISCPPGIEPADSFYPVIRGDQPTFVSLWVNMTYAKSHVHVAYPITVEGIGSDGKKRTSIAIVAWDLKDYDSMQPFVREAMLK